MTRAWSPNTAHPGSVPISGPFPGDAHVDRTALDGYNRGTTAAGWQSFEQVFGPSIAQVRALSARPLMLAEVGSTEQRGNKAGLDHRLLRPAGRPEVRGFVWFNHDKEAD